MLTLFRSAALCAVLLFGSLSADRRGGDSRRLRFTSRSGRDRISITSSVTAGRRHTWCCARGRIPASWSPFLRGTVASECGFSGRRRRRSGLLTPRPRRWLAEIPRGVPFMGSALRPRLRPRAWRLRKLFSRVSGFCGTINPWEPCRGKSWFAPRLREIPSPGRATDSTGRPAIAWWLKSSTAGCWRTGGFRRPAVDGRIKLRVTALSGEVPLTPLSGAALLNGKESQDERARETLTFLSYKEKFLAGSWRFNTYFGRDTLMSVRLLMPVLAPEAMRGGTARRAGAPCGRWRGGARGSHWRIRRAQPQKAGWLAQRRTDFRLWDDRWKLSAGACYSGLSSRQPRGPR